MVNFEQYGADTMAKTYIMLLRESNLMFNMSRFLGRLLFGIYVLILVLVSD